MQTQHKEAGGCITIYLTLIILGSSLSVAGGIITLFQSSDYFVMRSLLVLWPLIILRSTIALWNWKKWGLIVLSIHFNLFIILGILLLSVSLVLAGVLGLLLTFMLYYDKMDFLV